MNEQSTFDTVLQAEDFAAYLMSQNNQGHRQILIEFEGGLVVNYEYYDVIHDDLRDRVVAKISKIGEMK